MTAALTDIWFARVTAILALPAMALARESALALVLLAAWFLALGVGCIAAARTHHPDAPPTAWWTLAVILLAATGAAVALV
jgi:hypothetical protein